MVTLRCGVKVSCAGVYTMGLVIWRANHVYIHLVLPAPSSADVIVEKYIENYCA